MKSFILYLDSILVCHKVGIPMANPDQGRQSCRHHVLREVGTSCPRTPRYLRPSDFLGLWRRGTVNVCSCSPRTCRPSREGDELRESASPDSGSTRFSDFRFGWLRRDLRVSCFGRVVYSPVFDRSGYLNQIKNISKLTKNRNKRERPIFTNNILSMIS